MAPLSLQPDPLSSEVPGLRLKEVHWEQMHSHAAELAPQEACGLIAGRSNLGMKVYPLTNALHSPTRFRLDPREQLQAFFDIETRGWQLLAVYHSHPNGPAIPSTIDVREAYYPQIYNLIWSRIQENWICRAFHIQDGTVSEARLHRIG